MKQILYYTITMVQYIIKLVQINAWKITLVVIYVFFINRVNNCLMHVYKTLTAKKDNSDFDSSVCYFLQADSDNWYA